jgi:hypothetical protein
VRPQTTSVAFASRTPFSHWSTIFGQENQRNFGIAKQETRVSMGGFLSTLARHVNSAMKQKPLVALVFSLVSLTAFAQDEMPAFKAEAESALVWDKDVTESITSSTVWDPLTGHEIHRLSHAGIEVSSRIGFERVSSSEADKLINYTTTIANNTDSDVSVQYGGASADGQAAMPLWVALTTKGVNKRDRKNVWELSKMHCFKTGFASSENVFSAHTLSKSFTVPAQTAMTISSVSKDPRRYSVRCSVDGCHVTGTIRYHIMVNHTDYVFVWQGRSVVYCGE